MSTVKLRVKLTAKRDKDQARRGELDVHYFYLDDGLAAGSVPVVKCFFDKITRGLAGVGPAVSHEKAEIIPACTSVQALPAADSPGCCWNGSAKFKLIGAALLSGVVRTFAESPCRQGPLGATLTHKKRCAS